MEGVERAAVRDQRRALGRLEHLPDGPVLQLGMDGVLRVRDAAVLQPGVQLGIALEPQPRREEALADQPDLVLDLTLLPPRVGRACHRFDQVMSAHPLEAPLVAPLAADEDRVHRRLHVVVDAALAGPAQERERAVMRVEHHLLALARVRPHKKHPAVAKPQVRDLHHGGDAVDQHHLVAPVELVRLARREAQRQIGRRRRRRPITAPGRRVTAHRVVTATIAEPLQLLEHPDHRQPFAPRLAPVRLQQPIQLGRPRSQLRQRLHLALIGEAGLARADHLPDRVPRHAEVAHDLLDRLAQAARTRAGSAPPSPRPASPRPPPPQRTKA